MKRTLAILLCCLLIITAAACSGNNDPAATQSPDGSGTPEASVQPDASGDKSTLNILCWDGAFPEDVIADFEQTHNVTVNITGFPSNEEMLSKLQAANGGTYDVIIGSDYILETVIGLELAAELDKDIITNYSNLDPAYLSQYYDPDNKYTVPYMPGSPLIIYDPSKVSIEINGYADLWDESLKGQVQLLDDPRVGMAVPLKALDNSLNETDPDAMEEVRTKLLELAPNIRVLDSVQPHNALISGEASVGFMYTSQIALVKAAQPDFKLVYPEEGLGFGIDCIFVAANAPNKDIAFAFVNAICDGETSARCSEAIGYINCNTAAQEYLSAEFKANVAINIPPELQGDKEFITNIGDMADTYVSIWTEFKQAVQ